MVDITTEKDLRLKDGTFVPKGSPIKAKPIPDYDGHLAIEIAKGKTYRVRVTSVFQAPEMNIIESWCLYDGGAETPLGNWVEPDGYDEHGFPAWPKVLGYM